MPDSDPRIEFFYNLLYPLLSIFYGGCLPGGQMLTEDHSERFPNGRNTINRSIINQKTVLAATLLKDLS